MGSGPSGPRCCPQEKKGQNQKSTGELALMEQMQSELNSDMVDAAADEKIAQQEYAELMDNHATD